MRTRTRPAGAGATETGQAGGRSLSPAAPAPGAVAKASRGCREVAREALPGASAQGRRGSGGGAGTGPGSLAGRVRPGHSSGHALRGAGVCGDPRGLVGRAAECTHLSMQCQYLQLPKAFLCIFFSSFFF